MNREFYEKLEGIVKKDPRYKTDAYEFLMQALMVTQGKLKRKGHVSGKELLEGIKEYGLDLYGPMAKTVFKHWGITTTDDFGEIVFKMVEWGLMSKTDKDCRDDFKNVYDFDGAFDIFSIKKK